MIHKRLIHIVQRYPPALGGAESYFARLSSYLANHGERVEVHTSNALDLEAFWSPEARRLRPSVSDVAGVRVQRHAIRYFPGRKIILKTLSTIPHSWVQGLALPTSPQLPSLWSCTNDKRISLVHATAFPYTFPLFAGLRWAKQANVPFFLTPFLHLGDPGNPLDRMRQSYLSRPLLYLLQHADRIFVQTQLERETVLAQGIAGEKVVLQGLGVDPNECTGGTSRRANERWGLPNDDVPRIGHLANLSEEKGTNDLLRAMMLLIEKGIRCRCLLAGPQMPNFRRFWKQLPVTMRQCVHRLGVLTEEEKPDFFAALDLFALPSRSDSFGLVLLEAWANGVPSVGYRAGGIAEVIKHEETGLLAPCGNVPQLADCLQRLIQHAELREQLGQTGRESVLRENRWENKLAVVKREYKALT